MVACFSAPVVDEDTVRVHDEGVERFVVDDDDLHVLLAKPGDAQNRRGVVAQQLLDLGIANHRDAGGGAGLRPRRTLASATAAAAASATAREAGPAGRTLLGGLAAIMSGQISVPRSGTKLWTEPVTVNTGRRVAQLETKRHETRRIRQHRGGLCEAGHNRSRTN